MSYGAISGDAFLLSLCHASHVTLPDAEALIPARLLSPCYLIRHLGHLISDCYNSFDVRLCFGILHSPLPIPVSIFFLLFLFGLSFFHFAKPFCFVITFDLLVCLLSSVVIFQDIDVITFYLVVVVVRYLLAHQEDNQTFS